MYASAEDDAERKRIQAKLYAPPKELRRSRREGAKARQPQRGALTMQGAQSLMAQLAAQDAQLGAG
ncbi:hypothetical protein ACIOHS_27375 [Streptomyces sp. NPDC088253]|jgi:hypothetical protein|uniref:hypothetical protein n=1 Tax=Streptomyces sp. NPDC088253 TaxID=3365846 RepID=UPI00381213F4